MVGFGQAIIGLQLLFFLLQKSMEDILKGFAVVLLQDYSCQLSCQISSNCCFCTSDSNDPEKAKIKLMEYLIDIVL